MTPASWIEVSLTQLRANLAAFRAMIEAGRLARGDAAPSMVCGVVKADAFGVGVGPVARCLSDAGIDMLAVYSPEQAVPLAEMKLQCPILLLMPTLGLSLTPELSAMARRGTLHVTIHHEAQLRDIESIGDKHGCLINVHLMLDTGMSRAGLNAAQLVHLVDLAGGLKHVKLAGLFTHMASPDSDPPFTRAQAAKFDRAVGACIHRLPKDVLLHVANTFATLTDHAHHRQMIRVGLGLYGYGPESLQPEGMVQHAEKIKPIVRWLSRVVHVQKYPAGTPVGYNSTHQLKRDSTLGLVPAGYADGYPRSLSNLGVVELPELQSHGRPAACAVLGRVNMDQIVIDLTDAPAHVDQLLGALVEIYSNRPDSPCALSKLAAVAQTNAYELLCRLSPRAPRVYT